MAAMLSLTRRGALAALSSLIPAMAIAADLPEPETFESFDGTRLAVRSLGAGRPTLMLHGFLSDGASWFRTGLAQRLAAEGRRVIAPDFRGHGRSAAPTARAAYPKDVLARDQTALLQAWKIGDYDLVGYSMGSLVAVRMLVGGARPGRLVLGGMGDARVMGETPRDAMFREGAERGAAAAGEGARAVASRIAQRELKPEAIAGVLGSLGRTGAAELKRLTTPTLVVCGEGDNENGSAEGLAAALGQARAVRVPGVHGTAPAQPQFLDAVSQFLATTPA